MPTWNDTGSCNAIRGTDGTQFHPDLAPEDILYAFEPMLCRSLKFKHGLTNQQIKDIGTLRFYTVDDNFARSDENKCYCLFEEETDCLAGTLNLRQCPPASTPVPANIIASSPYFMNNLDLYKESGLTAPLPMTQENYGTILDLEPVSLPRKPGFNSNCKNLFLNLHFAVFFLSTLALPFELESDFN